MQFVLTEAFSAAAPGSLVSSPLGGAREPEVKCHSGSAIHRRSPPHPPRFLIRDRRLRDLLEKGYQEHSRHFTKYQSVARVLPR